LSKLYPYEKVNLIWLDFSCNGFENIKKYRELSRPNIYHEASNAITPYGYDNPSKTGTFLKTMKSRNIAYGRSKRSKHLRE
jgi:hypothetical protein